MTQEQHEKETRMERALLDAWIRRDGTVHARICARKGLTDQMVVAQMRGYWSA